MPFVIPPVLALTLGVIGSVAVARWIAKEARRINAELHPQPPEAVSNPGMTARLRRDPASGVYRPE